MPTLRDVARRAGVALSTASAVLNGRADCYASERTRCKIREAAAAIGYQPNQIARSLASGKTDTLGLIVYEVSNPFFAQIVDHIERAARAEGYHLLLCNSRADGEADDRANLQLLIRRQVDGILLWASDYPREGCRAPLPLGSGPKLVLLGHHTVDGSDYVALDRIAGSYQAAQHLIELGHTRLAYMAPRTALSPDNPKLAGVLCALAETGLPPPVLLPAEGNSRAAGRAAARQAREWRPRPTALLCYNDLTAIGAYWGLRDAGLAVPDDMALVGYDGIEEAGYLEEPLTTVEQPIAEMCRTAMRFLVDRIAGRAPQAQQRTLAPRLLVRASSGAALAPAPRPGENAGECHPIRPSLPRRNLP